MKTSIDKLTEAQKEVGYEKGKINNIALLGLFGEVGEVLDECVITDQNDESITWIENAASKARLVDSIKKRIRDREMPPYKIKIIDEEKFDSEMADTLYYLNALAINRGKTLEEYAEISYNKVMEHKLKNSHKHTNISHGSK